MSIKFGEGWGEYPGTGVTPESGVWHQSEGVWQEVPTFPEPDPIDNILVMCKIIRTKLEHIEQLLDLALKLNENYR
jgi:hypothetical protein